MRRLLLLVLVVMSFGAVLAQELTTGTLEGTVVKIGGGPIPDAVVTATGPQGSRAAVTNAQGRYAFQGLIPGSYSVKVMASGYATVVQSGVEVYIGRRTQLPFALTSGRVEEVTVTSEAPLVDMKSTAAGESIKVDNFAPYVPVGRNLVSTFSIAPGVVDGGSIGASNQSISGSSGLENAYFVDGVNITNSGYGALGAYSIVYGSLGTGVTYDFLEEVQVKTGGFEAEFGQAGGGVVNSVVKTGSNVFAVDASWYEEPTNLEGGRRDLILDPNQAVLTGSLRRDISASVGGPLVKDKLFYFLAYNPIWLEDNYKFVSGNSNTELYPFPDNPDQVITAPVGSTIQGGRVPGEVTRKRNIDNYAAKVSWFLTPNQRFEGTAFGDPSTGEVGPQSPTAYLRALADVVANPDASTSATGLDYGGDQYSFKWQGVWTTNFFSEFQYAKKKNKFAETGPGITYRSFYNPDTNAGRGGAGFYEDLRDDTDQYSLKLTNVIGPVELRYGFQYEDINWKQPQQYSGPAYDAYFARLVDNVPVDLYNNDTGAAGPDGAQDVDENGDPVFSTGLLGDGSLEDSYTVLHSSTGASVDEYPGDSLYNVTRTAFQPLGEYTNAKEKNAFVQATWDIRKNLTLKLGARWTEQTLKGAGTFTLPISLLESSGQPVGVGETTYAPKEYTFDSEIAPRVGISWDIFSNGKHKLFGNYGRYYQRVPNDLAVRQFSNEVGVEGELFDDADLTSPNFGGDCLINSGGGLYDQSVPCHIIESATGASPSVIIDGTIDPDGDGAINSATRLPYTQEYMAGYAWEVNDWSSLEFRYIKREIGRVLEDVQFASVEQTYNLYYGAEGIVQPSFTDVFPGHGIGAFGSYVLANPGSNVPGGLFPSPIRNYDALELVYSRRFHDGWLAYINYRFANLKGNYEGSYRNDNGQSDPFITSLFDFPAASGIDTNGDGIIDSYVTSNVIAGQFKYGPLNLDRRHVLNAFVSRQFKFGLNVGGALRMETGQPRFPLFAHPAYRNAGEIPGQNPVYWWTLPVDLGVIDPISGAVTYNGTRDGYGVYTNSNANTRYPAGLIQDFNEDGIPDRVVGSAYRTGPRLYSYDIVTRDVFGRNPSTVNVDLRFSYDWKFGKSTLTGMLDVFNIFSDTGALSFDDNVETRPGSPDPNYLKVNAYQSPRNVRLGVKWTW